MLEKVVGYALFFAAPLLLLTAAWIWLFRVGRRTALKRRLPFLCGLTAATVAYITQFFLQWYLARAHLGYWPEAYLTLDIGRIMLVAALTGFTTSWFGRGYGRIASCSASFLIFLTWFLVGGAAI
jgi:hypothetical protein